MFSTEVHATAARFGILLKPVLNVILRAVLHFLPVQTNGAMTVHATNIRRLCTDYFRDGHLLPAPFVARFNLVLAALLAAEH